MKMIISFVKPDSAADLKASCKITLTLAKN